jgi:hypothetical protein
MRVVRGAISLLVGPPGAGSSGPLGLEAGSGWLAPPPPPPLFELPMLPLALVCWRWALEELEAEGVDDTRERKLGITRCLKSRTSKLDRRPQDTHSLQENHLQVSKYTAAELKTRIIHPWHYFLVRFELSCVQYLYGCEFSWICLD